MDLTPEAQGREFSDPLVHDDLVRYLLAAIIHHEVSSTECQWVDRKYSSTEWLIYKKNTVHNARGKKGRRRTSINDLQLHVLLHPNEKRL
jgi:hypothetical protein